MAGSLQDYTASTADWRKQLKLNKRRTFFVITLFFLIYGGLGLLADAFAGSIEMPVITLIMLGVAGLSVFITFAMHKKLILLGTEHTEITADSSNPKEKQLYNIVEELKIASGLQFMPKIFIIEADYMNAFASGYSEKSALVAITRGLLEKLDRDEIQAVMAHELSHIKHMDIKLTLLATVLSNLILIVIDILFYSVLFGSKRNSRSSSSRGGNEAAVFLIIIVVLRYTLPIINALLILYLSRTREYMADAGSVKMMRTNEPLARALLKIQDDHKANRKMYSKIYKRTAHEEVRREAYIYLPKHAGIKSLTSVTDIFATHPNLDKRLAAIGFKKKDES